MSPVFGGQSDPACSKQQIPAHTYIEVPFFSPLPRQLKEQFILMLWLVYEKTDQTIGTWQGVFSVTKAQGGNTLAEKFTNYARTVLPHFACIKDLICAKVPVESFKTLP
ncbi:MAG: hypothetical protein RMJ87_13185 [Cytophagales bacterium]|nr:hypothetical protein [Bernardetiaceae bacterium]MDW8205976.1 hypothetical protein [Cytophagales bacterium]